MKAVYIEESAVKYIAQEHRLQSGEFEETILLVDFFRNCNNNDVADLHCRTSKDVGYIYTDNCSHSHPNCVIIDFTKVSDFINRDYCFVGNILQKIVKFALKQWNNYPLGSSEKRINDDHVILFPFPYVDNNPYKLLLNLSPRTGYTEKREFNCIYVANQGHGTFLTSGYDILNIKTINVEAKEICKPVPQKTSNIQVESMQVSCLEPYAQNELTGFLSYDAWMHYLTKNQRSFITKPLVGNERLEGAAGTGKTIALILRAIYLCMEAKKRNEQFKVLFICHSIATKDNLKDKILTASPIDRIIEPDYAPQSIELTTLQEWCMENLGNRVGSTELLDIDAQECKDIQYHFVSEVYARCLEYDFPTYRTMCSETFVEYLENTNNDTLIENLISEISITIKGRASCNLETYYVLPRLEGSIPLKNESDYNFTFLLYERYQEMLDTLGYFDNDDISLSSYLQLASPIWRRRRSSLGYDMIIIDETHLFSFNEYAIFHFLSRDEKQQHIIYAIDKSQAIGDKGLEKEKVKEHLQLKDVHEERFNTIFRSSPQIINLAFTVLTSGAEMFLNFENPMEKLNYSFTNSQELKSQKPEYFLYPTEDDIIVQTFMHVDEISRTLNIIKNRVLIVNTSHELESQLKKYANEHNKPCEVLVRRGDYETLSIAQRKNSYVMGYIDYIGGLEFDAVVIVGVDKGRVPKHDDTESTIYQNYTWHNRMYVAITRAKYVLHLIGNKTRTVSTMFSRAIELGMIDVRE